MAPDKASFRSALGTGSVFLVILLSAVSRAGRATARRLRRLSTALWQTVYAFGSAARERGSELLGGPLRDVVTGPAKRALFGRRLEVSATVLLIAPLLAVATNYWASLIGYMRIRNWVRGTWFGTDPQTAVFLAVGVLLALAAVSAALNSGLLPTALLVTAPVFGIAFTRYGQTLEYYGTVGIPNAVAVGCVLAVAFGVPIACTGFALGAIGRRTVSTLRGTSGDISGAEQV